MLTCSVDQSAYQLRYHLCWCTNGRKPILSSSTIRSKVEVTIREAGGFRHSFSSGLLTPVHAVKQPQRRSKAFLHPNSMQIDVRMIW